ncbi:MAG: hypothetical protein WC494_04045 [Candidatus Pacearchaeota archaeon]
MRGIFHSNRGISELIAYVLLITLTISISVLVYGWLKLYVAPGQESDCPEGVNLIISNYRCSPGNLEVTIKNKGRFTIDGFYVRVHNISNPEFGLYTLHSIAANGAEISPGEEFNYTYNSIKGNPPVDLSNLGEVTLIEVQPMIGTETNMILCSDYTSLKIEDCDIS